MIPIRLTMRNFLSYGDRPVSLDYTAFDVACVTGENGHGKSSAIVDAVTCALWGQARGTDARGAGVDDLIRQGADEMELEFAFEMDGQVYRVLRKRQRNRASILEFHVRNGEAWRALTAERIQDTQERVNRVLGIDYRTFVHSALVLQGRADVFTVAKPSERKDILAEVLGLRQYELREQAARERARDCERRAQLLDREIEEARGELAALPAVEAELQGAVAQLAAARATLAELRQEREGLEARRAELDRVRLRMAEAGRQMEENLRAAGELAATVARVEERCAGYAQLLAEREAVAAACAEHEAARTRVEALGGLARAYADLRAEAARLEESLAAEERRLRTEAEGLRRQREQVATRAGRREGAARRAAELEEAAAGFAALRAEQEALEARVARLYAESAALQGPIEVRNRRIEELRDRYRQVSGIAGMASCPLCDSPLEPGRRDELQAHIQSEGQALRAELDSLEREAGEKAAERVAAEARLAAVRAELGREAPVSAARSEARRDLEEAEAAQRELAALEAALATLEGDLAGNRFAPEARQRLEAVAAGMADLGYDPAEYELAVRREQELRPAAARMEEVRRAEHALAADTEMLAGYRGQLEAREGTATAARELLSTLAGQAAGLEPALARLEEVGRLLAAGEREERTLLERRATAAARQGQLRALAGRIADRERERADLVRERVYWAELAQAYGKNGVQALIIENAIPELEKEANDLLARWTDGRLHVRLLTQGATKGGNVFETLDIVIADEMGTRKYELFSGGERFRVDLALRVGLSKLLAGRAGARLRLLVVDEGFGTQDASGVERMVEALTDLRRDFDKILIVTHRQELKERFPFQIEVIKDPQEGSLIRVVA